MPKGVMISVLVLFLSILIVGAMFSLAAIGQPAITTFNTTTGPPPINCSNRPAGLLPGWYSSNVTLYAVSVAPISFPVNNLELSGIQSSAVILWYATGVVGQNDVIEMGFSNPNQLTLTIQAPEGALSVWNGCSQIPSFAYADGVLTVTAYNATTLTIFFPVKAAPPSISESEAILIVIIVVAGAAAFGAAIHSRKKK